MCYLHDITLNMVINTKKNNSLKTIEDISLEKYVFVQIKYAK